MKPWFIVNFNTIVSHIFPEIFIEIPQVVKKKWIFSSSALTTFIFFRFFTISLWQKTFFHILYLQHTLNRLFNNCKKLYWYWLSSSWDNEGVKLSPPKKKQTCYRKTCIHDWFFIHLLNFIDQLSSFVLCSRIKSKSLLIVGPSSEHWYSCGTWHIHMKTKFP